MSEETTYQFEIALDKIEELTEQNNKLQKRIFELQNQSSEVKIAPDTSHRSKLVFKEAEDAMKRYKDYLRKEFPSAKPKQTKRKSI